MYIAVIGSGECDQETYQIAYQVGRLIGEKRAILVCGGLGGVMEAACKGAKERGGLTVGILPTDSRNLANPYLDISLPTGMGEGRNFLIAKSADVVIAIGGEYGTLSEIGLALKMGKKVIGLQTWNLSRQGQSDKGIIEAKSPEEALHLALKVLNT